MADYILDTEYFPERTFPTNYWPVIGGGPTVTAASETPRSATEIDIAETHSASDLVAVIADTRSL